MSAIVIPDISPAELLARFRGPITDARPTYPERFHLRAKDAQGGDWLLATWDADFSPSDPDVLLGRTIVSVDIDEQSRNLTIGFSDGSTFRVTPDPYEPGDDVENWDLFTPEGLVLVYGPGDRWKLARGSDPC